MVSVALLAQRYAQPNDSKHQLVIRKATGNNLKKVDLHIPVGLMTCVTGVSGSGKSTLINDTLYRIVAAELNGASTAPAAYASCSGLDQFDKVVDIDQSPIGRTPRSNPATYTEIVYTHPRIVCWHPGGPFTRLQTGPASVLM